MEIQVFSGFMPLINSSFEPGEAQKTIQQMENATFRDIAQAEICYFTGQAEKCVEITEQYLMHPQIYVRLSANLLYCFSCLAGGNITGSKKCLEMITSCLKEAFEKNQSEEIKAACVFSAYLSTVLLHVPLKNLPPLEEYNKKLPIGIRLYALYILSHDAYLKNDYGRALGMAQAGIVMAERTYPIAVLYLYCIVSMCHINLKEQDKARDTFLTAWEIAKKDGFIEPFIEHHGLLQGILEACIRKSEPQLYRKIAKGVIAFSRGWIKLHNPSTDNKVTELLTPMEFSIAMLACRGWSNQEIGDMLELSLNTVKHYMTVILEKLDLTKREQLKEYVNQ